MKWLKRIVVTLMVVFAAFYLFSQPEDSADAVRSTFTAIGTGFGSIVTFFAALTA